MQRDYLGNAVTTGERPATLLAIDDFISGMLAYETRAERIVAAAEADPASCAANMYAGMLCMLLEAPQAGEHAAKYLAAAELAAPPATRREQLNVSMLRAWVDDAEATPADLDAMAAPDEATWRAERREVLLYED